ncbi:MAG: transpeptidase family protein [Treponema sp.]|jgi:cell division protein FtsI (penicillin-binding protein 3)|nr:transpeptidase family protein [Treponema sp.]
MFKRRYIVLFSFLGLFTLYLLIHYAVLMINGDPPSAPRTRVSLPERGSILDRNGRFFALSIRFADVSVWRPSIPRAGNPQNQPCIKIISEELSDILEMTPEEIHSRINSSESNFLYLKRQIDDGTARRLSSLIREKNIRGVMVQPIVGRIYPERNFASQVVGFVGDRNEGIEFAFNNVLSGVDNNGIGSQVVLTIDAYVQYILQQIAAQTMEETQAEAVMFVAMDPRTGDILGSASLPDFDPNNFRASDANSRMNRPVIWAFEPGSTFKIYTLAAFLDAGIISSDTAFYCNGVYNPIRGAPITCLVNHGRVTAREIIIRSCNVGAAYASENISSAAFHQRLSDFGFGSRTGAGSPGETAGYFVPVANWSERSKPTIAFGQEIAVSAYQMLQATSAIANDGVLVPPRIVSGIMSADGRTVTEWEVGPRKRILSAETARAMRAYMAATALPGAMGRHAGLQDLSIGVKTGTAQIIDPATRRYSDTDFIASCIALLPAENPSLVLYLAIVKPRGHIFGAQIAAPAIRDAAEALIGYFGIPRGRNPLITHPSSINIPAGRLPVLDTHVPDYTGLSKRILLPLLLRDDIIVEINGDGWVRRQHPAAGAPVTAGMTIVFELD